MVKPLVWVLVLTFGMTVAAQQKTQRTDAVTVIRAGTLIDGKSNSVRHDQVIVIRGNRVESVGDAASAKVPLIPAFNVVPVAASAFGFVTFIGSLPRSRGLFWVSDRNPSPVPHFAS